MIKHIPDKDNNTTYPMIMLSGEIQELLHIEEKYFNKEMVDVSEDVSYTLVQVGYSRGCI